MRQPNEPEDLEKFIKKISNEETPIQRALTVKRCPMHGTRFFDGAECPLCTAEERKTQRDAT